ncbi:SDR family NAD(P)-dependent oxidoreductase [Falsiroseomonas sp. HW251]|uniref:SDR family NAD(P)-dependent oxidoreductase n=1 Tax=Falsiroseomonas sp. HW251 TaxID=3390998 RepID=UPI003D310D49
MRGAAVVTGGAGGIGRAVVARLSREGYQVASWDLSPEVPGTALAIAVDVTDDAALQHAAAETEAALGRITVLVVNAGILGPTARAWEVPVEEVRRVLDANLLSGFLTCRAVIPRMLANPGPERGRIVLTGSAVGKEGSALSGPYAASKAGLMALAKVLGKELATEGILVNAIAPTVVRTAMERSMAEEIRADKLRRIPMGRFAEPEEVAAMVAFLCGPDCSFSTGAVFDLSGGRLYE